MIELSRTVRFCLNDDGQRAEAARHNGFSAWPPMRGLGRYYEFKVKCRGEADARTGYFVNIKHMDAAVRGHALPLVQRRLAEPGPAAEIPMGSLLAELIEAIQPPLSHSVHELSFGLTPLVSLTMNTAAMDRVLIRQRYEFSAAHRLNVPEFSDQHNREIFGKCNNPAGHGHNYQFEVAVSSPIDKQGRTLEIEALDAMVDQRAVEQLDHKHLNHDVPEFAQLNPSVEHIAQVIWQMLAEPIAGFAPGMELVEISVWETQKTACTYRGPGVGEVNP